MEQYYQEESVTFCDNYERRDEISQGKCNKSFPSSEIGESNLSSVGGGGGFECNICLDLVQDPVVTLCGHLYCWPCIYTWIHFQTADKQRLPPQCPVCKADISERTLIPLFNTQEGQTGKNSSSSSSSNLGGSGTMNIPNRPPSPSMRTVLDENERDEPMHGMYGQMAYARIFGNSEAQNSYRLVESNNPRLRRHLLEIDRSLSRVCIFLSCCVMCCLLLF